MSINLRVAKIMWDAYAFQAGGKTFDGKPLPTWDELGEERQSCWIAAASAASKAFDSMFNIYELNRVSDVEIPDMEVFGIPTMFSAGRIFPFAGEDVSLLVRVHRTRISGAGVDWAKMHGSKGL